MKLIYQTDIEMRQIELSFINTNSLMINLKFKKTLIGSSFAIKRAIIC